MKKLKHPPILRASIAALFSLAFAQTASVHATVLEWSGVGDTWNNPSHWRPNLTPATDPTPSELIFGRRPNLSINNSGPATVAVYSMTLAKGAPGFTLAGNDVTINSGGHVTNNSKNRLTISFINEPLLGNAGLIASAFQYGAGGAVFLGRPVTLNAARGDIRVTCSIGLEGPFATLIVTGDRNTTVEGAILDIGAGGATNRLIKEGRGTLTLNGRSTAIGNAFVESGTLLVNGSTTNANTFVNGGTLGGTGFIGGNVFNGSNVNPGNSPGTLTIGGNYTQNGNGTLTIEVRNAKDYDHLEVRGRATLNGTLRIVPEDGRMGLRDGDNLTIITARQRVVGEFHKVESPTILEFDVTYDDYEVVVEAKQGSFEKYAREEGLSVNQRAVGGGLDKVAFRNQQPKLVDYLNAQPVENLPDIFREISPEELTAIFTIGTSLANVQSTNLQRRTADLRAGSSGFTAAGYHAAGSGPSYSGTMGAAGATGYEGKEDKNVFVPTEENRWGVFLTGVGEWIDVDGDGNARGYDVTTGGFTVGVDYKVSPSFAVGMAAGYAGTGADLTNDGRIYINGGKLGVYATYFQAPAGAAGPSGKASKEVYVPENVTGSWYVDLAANAGYNSYDTKRSALQGTARGDTDGGELNVLVGTGYDWTIGALTIGPTATFQYTYIGIEDFTERGSLAPLTFKSQGSDSLRTALGFKASYDWRVGGVIIKPEFRAAWQHEYGSDATALDASFNNGSGNLFTVLGSEIGRDSMLLGAGFAVLWNERTSTYVYYDGELFRDNYEVHNVSGGIRFAF